jgi:hypothetical protein
MMDDDEPTAIDASSLWRGMPEALARENIGLAPLRNLSTRGRTSLALAGLGAAAIVVWLAFGRADWAVLPRYEFWLLWLPRALLAGYCARLLLWPAHQRAPAPWLQPSVLLAAVALCLAPSLLPELHREHPASLGGAGSDLPTAALSCTAIGVLLGGLCLGWVALFRQEPRTLGALPPSAWALLVIGQSALSALHCPLTAPIHLALGHGSLCLPVLGLVAALQCSRLGRSRARARESGQ